jgi:hypothetical protein
MRLPPPLLTYGLLVALAAVSGRAQDQPATRPEPPAPENVIPATVIPGINSTEPVTPAPTRPKGYDPLLDLPPLPQAQVTLIGGTVTSLDEVMNQMAFQPFGTKKEMRVHFDTRTRFFRDGAPISQRDIRQGQHVYLDTMLNGDRIFAKTIWIRGAAQEGNTRGQVIRVDTQRNTLTIRDELADQAIKLQVSPTTPVKRGNQQVSLSEVREGALVALTFGPKREVQEISLLATPGSVFTFAGQVTHLDLSRRLIAIANRSDNNTYDIYLDAIAPNVTRQLREGLNVNISAVFDGTQYSARSVDIQAASTAH